MSVAVHAVRVCEKRQLYRHKGLCVINYYYCSMVYQSWLECAACSALSGIMFLEMYKRLCARVRVLWPPAGGEGSGLIFASSLHYFALVK